MPFPITCTACHKTFSIADDVYERKVKGRVVTIKCKQCQAGIRIDGTQSGSAAVADANNPSAALEEGSSPVAAEAVRASQPALPSAALDAGAGPALKTATSTPLPDTPRATPKAEVRSTAVAREAPKTAPLTTAKAALATGKAAPLESANKPGAPDLGSKASLAVTVKATPQAGAVKIPAATAKGPAAPIATKSALASPKTPLAPLGTKPGLTPKAASVAAVAPAVGAPAAPAARAAPRTATATTGTAARPPAPSAPELNSPSPALSPTVPEVLWAVDYPDGQDRELTPTQIAKELASGAIDQTALVWREGMPDWLELAQVPELRSLLTAPKPPPPRAKAASAPEYEGKESGEEPTRVRAPSAPDLDFERPAQTGSTPHPPIPPRQPTISGIGRPAPPAPPSAFSPPAPAAASPIAPAIGSSPFTAGAPAPAPPALSAPGEQPEFPSLGAFPTAPVMVPAPSLAAPFATPLQPYQAPGAAVRATAATGAIPDWPEKKSRAPWIIAAIVLILAIAAAVYFVMQSAEDRIPPAAPISALSPAAAAPATPTPATAEHDTAPSSTNSAEAAPVTGSRVSSRSALEPPGTPITPGSAGFAEMFANGARRADDKKVGSGRFDANAAKAALAALAPDTVKCHEKGGPSGKASVVVTFEPSGRVESATIGDAPFAGTPSGACITGVLKRAAVAPFSGSAEVVTKIISLQ